MTFPAFLCIASAVIQMVLAAIVIAKAPQKRENRLFSLQLFLFTLWSLAELNLIHRGVSANAIKLLFTPGFLLSYFFCIFTAIYPENQPDAAIVKSRKNLLLFSIPALVLVFLLWSDRLITGFDGLAMGFSIDFGKLEFLVKGVLVGYLFLALSTLSNSRKKAESKVQMRRLRYTFTAMLLPVAAGSIIIAFSKWFIGGMTIYSFGLFPVLNIIMSIILSYTMLKYNLMEIDLIFSIGLVYTLLTAILAGSMELFQELMQAILNFSDLWSKVISVLIIAAIFSPLKELLIKLVNKFFGRQSFDSAKVMQFILNELRKVPEQTRLFNRLTGELQLVLDFSFAAIICNNEISALAPESPEKKLEPVHFKNLPVEINDIEAIIDHYASSADHELEKTAISLKQQDVRHYFPLCNEENFYGSFLLGPKNSKVPYTDTELNLVQGLTNEVPHIIENLQMIGRLLSQEKTAQEIQWARTMLKAISAPPGAGHFANLQIATYSTLSNEIKGDMIDICNDPENSFIGIYDAFHHGIQAVLTLNVIFAIFRSGPGLRDKLVLANRTLRQFSQQLCSAVTLINSSSAGVSIINSGNPSPLRLAEYKVQPVFSGESHPVGLNETLVPDLCEFKPVAGELLFISTNGLYKAFSQLHGESLESFLAQQSFLDAEACKGCILKAIEPITRKNYTDDITFIVAGVKK